MIEYLYDAIRATAAQDINISVIITDAEGAAVTEDCKIMLYDDAEMLGTFDGEHINNGFWNFTIPAAATVNLSGRYFYSICEKSNKLSFKQPIYLV